MKSLLTASDLYHATLLTFVKSEIRLRILVALEATVISEKEAKCVETDVSDELQ